MKWGEWTPPIKDVLSHKGNQESFLWRLRFVRGDAFRCGVSKPSKSSSMFFFNFLRWIGSLSAHLQDTHSLGEFSVDFLLSLKPIGIASSGCLPCASITLTTAGHNALLSLGTTTLSRSLGRFRSADFFKQCCLFWNVLHIIICVFLECIILECFLF